MPKETVSKIQQLAAKRRLPIRRSEDETDVIGSNLGHLYEYNENELAVMFIPAEPQPRLWASVKRKCLESGMVPRQIGDCEGAFSFDPANPRQVKTALDVIRVRPKKRISPEHLRALRAGLSKAARNPERAPSTEPLQAPTFDDPGVDGSSGLPRSL